MPTTGAGYQVKTDVDQYQTTPTGTPDFQDICAISVDETINESLDTYFKMCKDGNASNKVTALDPAWTITVKGESTNTALTSILSIRFSTDRTYPFEITDNFTGETITFNGEITAISNTKEVETVLEYSFELKVADGDITVA